jgi:hypothetical protein
MTNKDRILEEISSWPSEIDNKVDFFLEKSGLKDHAADINGTLKFNCEKISQNPFTLEIMDLDKSAKIFEADLFKGLEIYWKELLERMHGATLISMLRTQKWFEGMILGVYYENFFVFSSCLRGLIEAVCDSLEAIKISLDRLENKTELITQCIQGTLKEIYDIHDYLDKELEDALIHFAVARDTWRDKDTLGKDFESPNTHRKKKFRQYLESIDEKHREGIHLAWLDLCQITHPSMATTFAYVLPRVENERIDPESQTIGIERDYLEIMLFVVEHQDVIKNVCNEFLAYILVCNNALRKIPYPKVHLPHFLVITDEKSS